MKLSDLSIGTRLKSGFAAVLALAMLLAGLAWAQIHHIGGIVTEINDSWMVSVTQLNDMRSSLGDLRRSDFRYVLDSDPASWKTEEELRAGALQRYADAVKPYEATGISGPPERKLYEAYQATLGASQASWTKLRELARGGDAQRPQALAYLAGESRTTFDATDNALATLIAFNVRGAATMRDRSNAALSNADVYLAVGMAAVVVFGAVFAWWLSGSIVRPLHDGIAAARVMAGGDLSQPVTSRSNDEAGQLLAALAAMQGTLRSTITGIHQAAEQVGSASTEIASGNSDLSVRTEHQASNLQQTAASIEQLSATVVQGAESARQANRLAASAAEFATRGGQVVGEVVGTMSGISASSRRIADIIGVIDGIAFQTNILALNAAVEAARAGEQGRGFAVVASEVRTLAKRSADAAKEIKSLIQESVDRVGAGSEQVQRAGETMNDIVGAVRKVADLIGEVSAAAAEQDAGFRQVNTAVGNLDQTTQQNAALVEQSAAAAHSLRDQAQRLTQAVGRFRLGAAA